jgi:D-alanine-D-alanine ligase
MDKDITKRLLSQAGIKNAEYLVAEKDGPDLHFKEAEESLGTPMFIKPANQGSSIGVYKVRTEEEFENGMKQAFKFDTKLVVERGVEGREIECSVLGNTRPVASLPGELILSDDFYSFETKYISEDGVKLQIPAELKDEELSALQKTAIAAYKALECSGLARVDFFLTEEKEWMVNEINTLPGFTAISMYPQMWEASGISYSELIDQLIELSLTRFEVISQLKSAND